MPDSWRRLLHPRRDGYRPRSVTRPVAGDALGPDERAEITAGLDKPRVPPELAEAALAHLGGDANPLGAAVVATMSLSGYPEDSVRVIDGWVAGHGLAFAARAFAESAALARGHGGRRRRTVRYAGPDDARGAWWAEERAARRLRTLLAVAGEEEYREAEEHLAACRRTPEQRVVTSYLAPTRQDWVDECRANGDRSPVWMLLCSLSAPHQLDVFHGKVPVHEVPLHGPGVVATLAERVGAAATPLLTALLDDVDGWEEARMTLLGALAVLPGDEAFRALLDRVGQARVRPVLQEAAARFPARALRLLASAAADASPESAAELLAAHVRAHPEVVETVLPRLPERARAAVETVRAAEAARVPDAAPADLPPLLVTPPWTRPRKAAGPVVVEGLTPPAERAVRWAPGEREEWAEAPYDPGHGGAAGDWDQRIAAFRARRLGWHAQWNLLVKGPVDRLRPLIADWDPGYYWYDTEWMRLIAARFELDALPVALRVARANPASRGGLVVPFLDAGVAGLVADWLARLKTARRHVIAWLERHGADAVPYLVPAALGRPGRPGAGPRRRCG